MAAIRFKSETNLPINERKKKRISLEKFAWKNAELNKKFGRTFCETLYYSPFTFLAFTVSSQRPVLFRFMDVFLRENAKFEILWQIHSSKLNFETRCDHFSPLRMQSPSRMFLPFFHGWNGFWFILYFFAYPTKIFIETMLSAKQEDGKGNETVS